MVNQFPISPQGRTGSGAVRSSMHMQELMATLEQSWWSSLKSNLRDNFFPERLPPLKLTSQPVRVWDIWGDYNNCKPATVGSVIVHGLMLAGLIALSVAGARGVKQEVQKPVVELVTLDISPYIPISNKRNDTIGGGGGGGDRDKLQAPKGKLPKTAMEQFTPPAVVIRNDNPKLPMEPTVVIPPQVKIPVVNMPTLGDPLAKVVGPPSNGTGSGGGIGSGSGDERRSQLPSVLIRRRGPHGCTSIFGVLSWLYFCQAVLMPLQKNPRRVRCGVIRRYGELMWSVATSSRRA